MIKKSFILTAYVDKKLKHGIKRSLSVDVCTRWNSTSYMLNTFLIFKPVIVNLHSEKYNLKLKTDQRLRSAGYDLSANDWNKLSIVQSVLKIFVAATTTMSASSYPTVGIGLFFIRRIKAHLELSSTDTPMIKSLKQQLLSQMTYYFESDPEQVDAFKLRAWFDPIALDVVTTKEKVALERDIKSISKIYRLTPIQFHHQLRLQLINNATTNTSPSSSLTQGSTSSRKPKDSMKRFLRLTGQENSSESKQKPTSIAGEIALYSSMAQKKNAIALKSEPLSFWSKQGDELPLLKELASKYLTTPEISVPSESAFSVADFVGRKERARLTAKTLSYLVFLKDLIVSLFDLDLIAKRFKNRFLI
ncbi:unnamed protein product [Didymodactylos carnosus]|uniref:HAT C-terminal dimerisation domain-containing protein n=1 Tax=Didymodactylos carnosus TaxID=1234261 RepID=A0A814QBW1_9BILA|nr:unnamed protein product [Didymodactylos carnosus]CAF1143605.1 unnamed protein product [Didymodactylos carnosus]CAF3882234.1 unnamed protein product [Didymodactylos carnosus]CAF3942718.1 unnamed protein product [Didymodactylos carnosus]